MTEQSERIKAAVARDEAAAEQDETGGPTFEAPETPAEPEPTEPEPEPEPEPAPEPETPASTMDAEQAAELEKALAAYFKRIEKVFGAGNVPPACPACEGLGFDLTGGVGAPELDAHEQYIECAECHGFGQVKTGSKVPGHDLHDCPGCLGRGYLERLPAPAAVPSEPGTYGTPAWMGDVNSGYQGASG